MHEAGPAAGILRRRTFMAGVGLLGATAALTACTPGGRGAAGNAAPPHGTAGGSLGSSAAGPVPVAAVQSAGTRVQQIAVGDMPSSTGGGGRLTTAMRPAVGGEWLSGVQEVQPFRLLGVTWPAAEREGEQLALSVRIRSNGRWGAWQAMEAMETAPTRTEASSTGARSGTEPLAVPPSDAVQVRVTSATAGAPAGLRLELIDPGASQGDGAAVIAPAGLTTLPTIVSRAHWGADESWRNDVPHYTTTIKAGVVHHTAGSNTYATPADARAQVRGVYAYHTRSLGWADIGYHFLVDKFGTIYEGRAGGIDRPVRGAHAGGFNTDTFGVSVLGDYETAAVTPAILDSVCEVLAWKLGLHGVDPNATVQLVCEGGGTSRYAAGTVVSVATIIGHRDVGATACPGQHLYAEMAGIRSRVTSLLAAGAGPQVTRLAGADRYETSAAQARAIHPGSRTVVLVSGEDDHLVDGLVAAPLAVQRQAPVLLSRRDDLPDAVIQEVQRRAATAAYLVGGTTSLGQRVEDQLRSSGVTQVVRIGGADRYSTAAQVALTMAEAGVDRIAVLASGETAHVIDALTVGGPAGATNRPVLLVRADGAPEATLDALQRIRPTQLVVVGGTDSISEQAVGGALSRLGLPPEQRLRRPPGRSGVWHRSPACCRHCRRRSTGLDRRRRTTPRPRTPSRTSWAVCGSCPARRRSSGTNRSRTPMEPGRSTSPAQSGFDSYSWATSTRTGRSALRLAAPWSGRSDATA